ncbi:hypothetical protein F4819DRAFT_331408 [Hypoxylon fuscum]|nr:hypothetical protein F4819DRAFT_331408 [Hypoxylon fuscum]
MFMRFIFPFRSTTNAQTMTFTHAPSFTSRSYLHFGINPESLALAQSFRSSLNLAASLAIRLVIAPTPALVVLVVVPAQVPADDATTVAVKAISAVTVPTALRRPSRATAAARLATSAVTALRVVPPWPAVKVAPPRSATSAARLATLHATALMPTLPAAATVAAAVVVVATLAAAAAATVVAVRVARLATPAAATATCLASALMAPSATTVARTVTSPAIAPRQRLSARRSATDASSLVMSRLSAPTTNRVYAFED